MHRAQTTWDDLALCPNGLTAPGLGGPISAMRWAHQCGARGRSIAASVLLAAGLVAVSAGPAEAQAICTYDTASRTASVNFNDVSLVRVKAVAGWLDINDTSCVQLNEVNTVNVNLGSSTSRTLLFDLTGGPLGPGFSPETDGAAEIEFTVAGFGAGSSLFIYGSNSGEEIRIGQYRNNTTGVTTGQVDLNRHAQTSGDVDISFTTFPDVFGVQAGPGNDVISGGGLGTGVVSAPYSRGLRLQGETGSDQVTGGSGNDFLELTTNEYSGDAVAGGLGIDQLSIRNPGKYEPATFSMDGVANDGYLCPGAECEADNVGADIEVVSGSAVDETIIGTKGPQRLEGSGGSDVLRGAGGNDLIYGGVDVPIVASGGGGSDTFVVSRRPDQLIGGRGRDTVQFSASEPVKVRLDGLANDGIAGQFLNVPKDVENVVGTPYDDLLVGNGLRNELSGLAGHDTIRGGGGDDNLLGGAGDDTLSGKGGNDSLDGGADIDVCRQGAGSGPVLNCEG